MKGYSIREKVNGDLVDHLLHYRNIREPEEKHGFLNPNYDLQTHDPFLLKDAEKAARRIIKAIENNEKVVVYSDYDGDGIPAGVVYHDFFKKIGFKNFINYIPHRHNEGFGLNVEAVEQFVKDGVKLLITLDCGISDVEAVRVGSEKGIDIIITDHHEPHEELPPAFAIVDHKQKDCNYPEKILCGSGVGFKLIQAILKINRFGLKAGLPNSSEQVFATRPRSDGLHSGLPTTITDLGLSLCLSLIIFFTSFTIAATVPFLSLFILSKCSTYL